MNCLQVVELFISTVREGSFSAAARRAGLSPTLVSLHRRARSAVRRAAVQLQHLIGRIGRDLSLAARLQRGIFAGAQPICERKLAG